MLFDRVEAAAKHGRTRKCPSHKHTGQPPLWLYIFLTVVNRRGPRRSQQYTEHHNQAQTYICADLHINISCINKYTQSAYAKSNAWRDYEVCVMYHVYTLMLMVRHRDSQSIRNVHARNQSSHQHVLYILPAMVWTLYMLGE